MNPKYFFSVSKLATGLLNRGDGRGNYEYILGKSIEKEIIVCVNMWFERKKMDFVLCTGGCREFKETGGIWKIEGWKKMGNVPSSCFGDALA